MENSLIIRQVKEHEYEEMLDLQWKILFKPYGKDKNTVRKIIDEEKNNLYFFVGLIDSEIEGAARLKKLNETEGRIEYMAIKKESEIKRIGPSILNFIEWYARGLKLEKILAQVREDYENVFETCQYEKKGPRKAKVNDAQMVIWRKAL
ncbi:MAG: GNAT family N-acetyltransferase [Promethearchaeia archaeon]